MAEVQLPETIELSLAEVGIVVIAASEVGALPARPHRDLTTRQIGPVACWL